MLCARIRVFVFGMDARHDAVSAIPLKIRPGENESSLQICHDCKLQTGSLAIKKWHAGGRRPNGAS